MNFRVAFRSLWKARGFAITAVFTLALGIGAVSAIFSVVNSVLLKPLAGVETESIVKLFEKFPSGGEYARARTYREWRKLSEVFDELGVRTYCSPTLSGLGEPEQLTAACVSESWFRVLRAQAQLGRTFLPDEDKQGRAQVAVLDYGFWMRRFGGDKSVVGRSIVLDLKPYLVAGVMPKDFLPLGKGAADLYIPWVLEANEMTGVEVIARLKPVASIAGARTALSVVQARLAQTKAEDYKGVGIDVQLLRETMVGRTRDLLRLLIAAAGLVLLIACVNVANLFLARDAAKHRETEIRVFLGANRRQLIMPALMESSIVAFAGASVGLALAWAVARVLSMRLENFPRSEEIGVDVRVALVTLSISIVAAIGSGLTPIFFKKRRNRNALVVTEVALTFVLLICSGLLIRSFTAMRQVDLGYNPSGVILGFIAQPEDPHDKRDAAIVLWKRVRERIAALPDVEAVANTTATPAGGLNAGFQVVVEGQDLAKVPADQPNASAVVATGEYFRVAGIALRTGRIFDAHDSVTAPPVVMVSQSIADRYFQGRAVGKSIQLPSFDFNVTKTLAVTLHEIVGVVADVKQISVQETGHMTLYLPESQNAVRYTTIIARAKSGDPMRLEKQTRRVVYEEAPSLAIAPMLTLNQGNAYLTRTPLQAMWLLGAFAALALLLACVGVHGVIAYATAQRQREMGIRMALGARPGQLFQLVTKQALRLAMFGVTIGIVGAYASTRLLESLLFGVGRTDAATYLAGIAALIGVAAIASFTPAIRAASTDPAITLRAE
jgi:putative ABC transport system permease protein